jgi:hypothetical protein
VPSDADFNASIINSILVCEDSGNADTISITVTNGSDVFNIFKVKAVGANTTVELLTKDLILQSGEILKVQAATANRLHVVASIQELSKTRVTTSAITRI